MEQIPLREVDSHLAGEEIPQLLSQIFITITLPNPILSQLNPVPFYVPWLMPKNPTRSDALF
jgi:hypothetical protein